MIRVKAQPVERAQWHRVARESGRQVTLLTFVFSL